MKRVASSTLRCLFLCVLLGACGPQPQAASPPPSQETESGKGSPSRAALFVRATLGAPAACGSFLRANDQDGWWACRESQPEAAGQEDALVPVGCYDRSVGDWVGDCVPGPGTRSASGSAVSPGESAAVVCDASGDWIEGTLAAFSEGDSSPVAVEGAKVVLAVRDSTAGIGEQQTAKVLEQAQELVRDKTGKPVVVRQVVHADLDGDGKDDWLVSVESMTEEEVPGRSLGALFLLWGAAPEAPITLMSSEIEAFTVLALTDLDQDGRSEMLVESQYYEGNYIFFYRFAGDDLVQLGGWGCGA